MKVFQLAGDTRRTAVSTVSLYTLSTLCIMLPYLQQQELQTFRCLDIIPPASQQSLALWAGVNKGQCCYRFQDGPHHTSTATISKLTLVILIILEKVVLCTPPPPASRGQVGQIPEAEVGDVAEAGHRPQPSGDGGVQGGGVQGDHVGEHRAEYIQPQKSVSSY